MIIKESHQHKYTKTRKQKVLVNAGIKLAVDLLYQRVCVEKINGKECGAFQTYDLERSVK